MQGTGTAQNELRQNRIGTADLPNGTPADSATGDGVAILGGSVGTKVVANLIVGNLRHGVRVGGTGTDATALVGNRVIGNEGVGVLVDLGASRTAIGGSEEGDSNVISGNSDGGVALVGSLSVVPPGVARGPAAQSTSHGATLSRQPLSAGSGARCPAVAPRWPIIGHGYGAESPAGALPTLRVRQSQLREARTVAARGSSSVVREEAGCLACHHGNQLAWNYIGSDEDGAPLPNGLREAPRPGVTVRGSGNLIGPGNVIAWNTGPGVQIGAGAGNVVRTNSIYSNSGLGIDLAGDGVTPNGSGLSINAGQQFPEWANKVGRANGFGGTLRGSASTRYRLEIFANESCDPSGHGEGATLLRLVRVTTGMSGLARFKLDVSDDELRRGPVITATATGPDGSTSEFSPCLYVVRPRLYMPAVTSGGP